MIFMSFSQDVQRGLDHYQRRLLQRPDRAAVLIPILQDEQGARIVLTRRASSLGSHAGEVSFPGGKVDTQDRDLIATALRESEEEINLKSSDVEILGMLDDMVPKKRTMAVTPVIGLIHNTPQFKANPDEVARIFTIPINYLYQTNHWRCEQHQWEEQIWPIYYCDYDNELLWGLSAYMTLIMLSLTQRGSPVDLSWMSRRLP